MTKLNFIFLLLLTITVGFLLIGIVSWPKAPTVKPPTKSQVVSPPPETIAATISGTIFVPILMYHYVEVVTDTRDTIRQSLNIEPVVFEAQLQTLKGANYNFLTAKELGEIIDGKRPLPPKPIVLTFDDGHYDLATDVLPLLQKYQVPATAYIISGRVDKDSDFLTLEQLHKITSSGHFEIGAHTVSHRALRGQPEKIQREEILASKEALEQELGISVVSFAYPDGSFDDQAKKIVAESGYTTAVSTLKGASQSASNRFSLYRLRPGQRTGQKLLDFLTGSRF